MSNIYLHRLDEFVETVLIPEYTRGRIRKQDTGYARVRAARDRAHKRGDHASARELRKQLRGMPSGDPHDPGFRRLHYARYADDTLLGFTGPRAEAEEILQEVFVQVWNLFNAGQVDEAQTTFSRYATLLNLLSQGNGIAFYLSKEVLRLRGLFTNTDVRKPATEPDAIAYRELRHQVEVLGLARVMTR